MIKVRILEPDEFDETEKDQIYSDFGKVQRTPNLETKTFNEIMTEPQEHTAKEVYALLSTVNDMEAINICDAYIALLNINLGRLLAGDHVQEAIALLSETREYLTRTNYQIYRKADIYIKPNDKTSNSLFGYGDSINRDFSKTELYNEVFSSEGSTLLTVPAKNDPKSITIRLENRDKLCLDSFDGAVYTAVCSILLSPANSEFPNVMTPNMIWQAMSRKNTNVQREMEEKIVKSMEKLSTTRIYMDCTEEESEYPDLKPKKYKIGANLLYTKFAEDTEVINGKKAERYYKILDIPILYQYASEKGQVISIPYSHIKTSVKKKTMDVISLENYLIQRIAPMSSNKSKIANIILLETVYKKCLYGKSYKNKIQENKAKARLRKNLLNTLDDFKKNKFIKDYKPEYKGKELIKIQILPKSKNRGHS